jgi:catechol 2,3-dioxygenase-like lactoylglutathione lyase family enzyme
MLTAILMVTLVVPNLADAERAYAEWLGFRVSERGSISPQLAASWGTPLVAGSPYLLLKSASDSAVYLRVIERPPTAGYAAMRTHGWNSNEILVEDPAALERRFRAADSPFRVIGPTAPLGSNSKVIAMQALGPAEELNYFTRIPSEGGTYIKTPAKAFVDRTFIVVLGGPSMDAMRAFYRDILGQHVTEPYSSTVGVLQAALNLPADGKIRIALATLAPGFLIELDEYPAVTVPRPQRAGDLPPGMAMVSFTAKTSLVDKSLGPARAHPEAPYFGRKVALLRGAAGEWLEIVADHVPVSESTDSD